MLRRFNEYIYMLMGWDQENDEEIVPRRVHRGPAVHPALSQLLRLLGQLGPRQQHLPAGSQLQHGRALRAAGRRDRAQLPQLQQLQRVAQTAEDAQAGGTGGLQGRVRVVPTHQMFRCPERGVHGQGCPVQKSGHHSRLQH